MNVPFVDLAAQYEHIGNEIDDAIAQVVSSRAFIKGRHVEEFENSFAEFCRAKHCVGVGNGTDALFVALKALGVGAGDEVLVPANSFVATSEAVTMAGARPVFVDVSPQYYTIDVELIEACITENTKAIVPVHLYGQPVDLPAIRMLADRHGLKIVQDCAQAHGAAIGGHPLSEYGDALCYSFFPGKNLGAYGDGGAVVTNDDGAAEWIRKFANHGRMSKYDHEFEGINSRLDGLQAAVLNVKLKYLDGWTEQRINNARLYSEMLQGVGDIVTPVTAPEYRHVFHLYVIRTAKRVAVQQQLSSRGIASGIHYPVALPNLTAYKHLGHAPEDFPISSRYSQEILSLPIYPELTEKMIGHVVAALKNA